MSTNNEAGYLSFKTKRSLITSLFTLGPPLFYFHKHRKVLLSSVMLRKTSYYDPKAANTLGTSSYNKTHHIKEIAARLFFGYLAGSLVALCVCGPQKVEEVANSEEIDTIENEESV